MVTKKEALKAAGWSAVAIAAITYFAPNIINIDPYIAAGVSTFLIGYFGMIKK